MNDTKKAIAIIQARMSSSRLPGKVLKTLAGKPVIWHIHDRLNRCKLIDKIIVATSNHATDDILADFCKNNDIECYRGSLEDVLSRFLYVLKKYPEYSYFARITGDCPLIHPQFIDNQVSALSLFDGDITWCKNSGSALAGQGVRSARSLFFVDKNSTDTRDRMDAVGSIFIAKNPKLFRIVELCPPDELVVDNIRLTIDEEKDYEFLSKLYDLLWSKNEYIKLQEVLLMLKEHSELCDINNQIQHSELNQEVIKLKSKWEDANKVGIFKYK